MRVVEAIDVPIHEIEKLLARGRVIKADYNRDGDREYGALQAIRQRRGQVEGQLTFSERWVEVERLYVF